MLRAEQSFHLIASSDSESVKAFNDSKYLAGAIGCLAQEVWGSTNWISVCCLLLPSGKVGFL